MFLTMKLVSELPFTTVSSVELRVYVFLATKATFSRGQCLWDNISSLTENPSEFDTRVGFIYVRDVSKQNILKSEAAEKGHPYD